MPTLEELDEVGCPPPETPALPPGGNKLVEELWSKGEPLEQVVGVADQMLI